MVIDKRKQERKIIINFKLDGCKHSIDEIIDNILPDLKTVLIQRLLHNTNIEITIE